MKQEEEPKVSGRVLTRSAIIFDAVFCIVQIVTFLVIESFIGSEKTVLLAQNMASFFIKCSLVAIVAFVLCATLGEQRVLAVKSVALAVITFFLLSAMWSSSITILPGIILFVIFGVIAYILYESICATLAGLIILVISKEEKIIVGVIITEIIFAVACWGIPYGFVWIFG